MTDEYAQILARLKMLEDKATPIDSTYDDHATTMVIANLRNSLVEADNEIERLNNTVFAQTNIITNLTAKLDKAQKANQFFQAAIDLSAEAPLTGAEDNFITMWLIENTDWDLVGYKLSVVEAQALAKALDEEDGVTYRTPAALQRIVKKSFGVS